MAFQIAYHWQGQQYSEVLGWPSRVRRANWERLCRQKQKEADEIERARKG